MLSVPFIHVLTVAVCISTAVVLPFIVFHYSRHVPLRGSPTGYGVSSVPECDMVTLTMKRDAENRKLDEKDAELVRACDAHAALFYAVTDELSRLLSRLSAEWSDRVSGDLSGDLATVRRLAVKRAMVGDAGRFFNGELNRNRGGDFIHAEQPWDYESLTDIIADLWRDVYGVVPHSPDVDWTDKLVGYTLTKTKND